MRTIAIAMALPSVLFATPASARNGAFYVGGEVGLMLVDDMDIDVALVPNAVATDHNIGFEGGLFAGYDFGAVRLEAEAGYKTASLDTYTTTIRLPLEPPNFPTQGDALGKSRALSLMINGMLDLGDEDGTSFFIGAGVGMARVEASEYRNYADSTPFLDGSDWKLAWQGLAGVRHAVSDNLDLTLRYRFFNAGRTELIAFNGGESGIRFRSHSLLVGLTFNFGY